MAFEGPEWLFIQRIINDNINDKCLSDVAKSNVLTSGIYNVGSQWPSG